MNFLRSSKVKPLLFFAVLCIAVAWLPNHAFAMQGDVSQGKNAITQNPDSYYAVWIKPCAIDPSYTDLYSCKNQKNLSNKFTAQVVVTSRCQNNNIIGFDAAVDSGGTNADQHNPDTNWSWKYPKVCNNGGQTIQVKMTVEFDYTNAANSNRHIAPCKLWDATGQFCTIIFKIHADLTYGPNSNGGHFTYNIDLANQTNLLRIGHAGQINPLCINNTPPISPGDCDGYDIYHHSQPLPPAYHEFGSFAQDESFTFKAPCNINSTVYVGWTGVDDGSGQQPNDLYFQITSSDLFFPDYISPTGEPPPGSLDGIPDHNEAYNERNTAPDSTNDLLAEFFFGTNGGSFFQSKYFGIRGGYNYTWSWHRVSGNNEIVYTLPYSEITQNTECYQLDGHSTVAAGTTAGKGTGIVTLKHQTDPATFAHWVHIAGQDTANFSWDLQGRYYDNSNHTWSNWGDGNCGANGSGETTVTHATDGGGSCPPGQLLGNDTASLSPGDPTGCNLATADHGVTPCHEETYHFPSTAIAGDQYCERIHYTNYGGPGSGDAASNENYADLNSDTGVCATYQPASATTPICGSISTNPTRIQPNQSFTFQVGVDYQNATPPAGSGSDVFKVKLNGVSQTMNGGATVNSHSVASGNFSQTIANANDYTAQWDVYDKNGNPLVTGCSGPVPIVDLPFFKVRGGSISAAGDYAITTPACDGGIIGGWFDNASGNYGASSRLAALANLKITGFASAYSTSLNSPSGDYPGEALTFANKAGSTFTSSDVDSPGLGGDLALQNNCISVDKPSSSPTLKATSEHIDGSSQSLEYWTPPTGVYTITGGAIPNQKTIQLYVNGDVYIQHNITYNSSTWPAESDVPNFKLVANGNIYIDPTVTRLDGEYVAQPTRGGSSADGIIFTCANSSGGLSQALFWANCNYPLTVYGSLTAHQLNLMRTYGTLDEAGTGNCSNSPGISQPDNSCAAEIIQLGPEFYLNQASGGSLPKWESVTSLPPVL